jgi:small-conductance mechanosensitive channel
MAVEQVLAESYQEWAFQAVVFCATFAGVYLVGRFLIVPPVVRAVHFRNENNPTLVQAVGLYLRVTFATVAFPVAIAAAGLGRYLSGSAVVVAAVTLAVGVAGQDVISNLVSGVFLVADRNFNVGDTIRWNGRTGTVVKVGLRTTRVRTATNEIVTVPNNDLSTTPLTHPFDGVRYRVDEGIVLDYGSDLSRVRAAMTETAENDDRVLDSPKPAVHVESLGPNAIEATVRYWIVDPAVTDIAATRTDVAERLLERLDDEGVTVAPAGTRELSGEVTVRESPPGDRSEPSADT